MHIPPPFFKEKGALESDEERAGTRGARKEKSRKRTGGDQGAQGSPTGGIEPNGKVKEAKERAQRRRSFERKSEEIASKQTKTSTSEEKGNEGPPEGTTGSRREPPKQGGTTPGRNTGETKKKGDRAKERKWPTSGTPTTEIGRKTNQEKPSRDHHTGVGARLRSSRQGGNDSQNGSHIPTGKTPENRRSTNTESTRDIQEVPKECEEAAREGNT